MDEESNRLYLPTFSDLIDQLTIDQIREVLKPENKDSYAEEMKKIIQDIDVLVEKKQIKMSARLIRIIIVLAQINLHIWRAKEIMISDQNRFDECMKLTHQLNGIRNQMKNFLMEEAGFKEAVGKRTNVNTDNLKGWNISI